MKKTPTDQDKLDRIVAEARRRSEQGYRERALKMFPWICARCGREFSGKTLRLLTVHHKDHNHDHNPPDGSNWELLCLYCHDNEHARLSDQEWYEQGAPQQEDAPEDTHRPFANLASLLKAQEKDKQ